MSAFQNNAFQGNAFQITRAATGHSGVRRLEQAKPWWEKPQPRIYDVDVPKAVEVTEDIFAPEAVEEIPQYIKEKIELVAIAEIHGDVKLALQSALARSDITYHAEYLSYLVEKRKVKDAQDDDDAAIMLLLS